MPDDEVQDDRLDIEVYNEKVESNEELSKSEIKQQRWELVGFQRQLGGWFYGFGISIVTSIFGFILIGFLTQLLYPYPEQRGYLDISGVLFAVVYQIFDFGTAFGIKRFIAEYRVKDPKKMLEYIRFFVWYQMFTGVIQVLVLSIIVFQFVIASNLAYVSWIMLIMLQKQWPGMLGTWKACIDGLQHHNKTHILNFISGEVFQQATNVIFILLGRWIGGQNPAVGELMGMVIGMAIGGYIDDFFAMMLSGYYFNKIMKPYGISFRETWRFDVGKDVIRNCLYYGAQVSIVPVIGTFVGTAITLMYLQGIPQYTTWKALAGLAGGIAGIVSVWDFGLTPSIAESYPNGKKKLAEFYISYCFKWQNFLAMLFFIVLMAYLPSVIYFIDNMAGLENYRLAVVFILPLVIRKLFGPLFNIHGDVLNGTLHITFYSILNVVKIFLGWFFAWWFLFGLGLINQFGFGAVVFVIVFDGFFPDLIAMIIGWIYIIKIKKILSIRIYLMSSIILPLLSGTPVFIFAFIWNGLVFHPLVDLVGLEITAGLTVGIGAFVIPFFFYMPFTGMLGSWDDFQLWTFKQAMKLSGPSKIFFIPFYKAIMFGVKIGKKVGLHNRFKIPWEKAQKEMIELNEMKLNNTFKKSEGPVSKDAFWMKKTDLDQNDKEE